MSAQAEQERCIGERELRSFSTVVCDIGGVILHGPGMQSNQYLLDRFQKIYGLSIEELPGFEEYFEGLLGLHQVATIDTREFGSRLSHMYGPPRRSFYVRRVLAQGSSDPDIAMVAALLRLREQRIRLVLASNTIESHWVDMKRDLKRVGLPIEEVGRILSVASAREKAKTIEQCGHIPAFTSFHMRVRKGGNYSGRTFFGLLREILEESRVLVVDDREDYCAEARAMGWQTYHFTTSVKFTRDLNLD